VSGSRGLADSGARSAFQVLERTFGILEVFTESQPEWSTTRIARELDLPVPTVHRILADTGETALPTVLSPARDRSVCLERVETSQPLRLPVQPGRQLPLYAGASQIRDTHIGPAATPARDESSR
jgi:DNA-binding IclR family transcriptional regulator